MIAKETTRRDIDAKISKMGEYVKIDYLSSCLKQPLDFDTRKFVLTSLSDSYIARGMFSDAGKMMLIASEINTSFQNKLNDYVKTMDLFVRGNDTEKVISVMGRALVIANDTQKNEIKNKVKSFYNLQAELLIKKNKRRQAITLYENLLDFELNDSERKEVQDKLLNLYHALGLMKEYYILKRKK
ncbi:MAG: hypothetical protein AABY10_02490 [Nanoarchaeota archaeon]